MMNHLRIRRNENRLLPGMRKKKRKFVINKNRINDLTCLKNYRRFDLLVGRVVETVQKC